MKKSTPKTGLSQYSEGGRGRGTKIKKNKTGDNFIPSPVWYATPTFIGSISYKLPRMHASSYHSNKPDKMYFVSYFAVSGYNTPAAAPSVDRGPPHGHVLHSVHLREHLARAIRLHSSDHVRESHLQYATAGAHAEQTTTSRETTKEIKINHCTLGVSIQG